MEPDVTVFVSECQRDVLPQQADPMKVTTFVSAYKNHSGSKLQVGKGLRATTRVF